MLLAIFVVVVHVQAHADRAKYLKTQKKMEALDHDVKCYGPGYCSVAPKNWRAQNWDCDSDADCIETFPQIHAMVKASKGKMKMVCGNANEWGRGTDFESNDLCDVYWEKKPFCSNGVCWPYYGFDCNDVDDCNSRSYHKHQGWQEWVKLLRHVGWGMECTSNSCPWGDGYDCCEMRTNMNTCDPCLFGNCERKSEAGTRGSGVVGPGNSKHHHWHEWTFQTLYANKCRNYARKYKWKYGMRYKPGKEHKYKCMLGKYNAAEPCPPGEKCESYIDNNGKSEQFYWQTTGTCVKDYPHSLAKDRVRRMSDLRKVRGGARRHRRGAKKPSPYDG